MALVCLPGWWPASALVLLRHRRLLSKQRLVLPAPRAGRSLSLTAARALTALAITSSSLNGPCKPAFDRARDIWAGNYNSNTIAEFTRAQIAKSGSRNAKVVISSSSYSSPGDVAVSPSGDLSVPYFGISTFAVAEFTKAQLAKSGSPTPAVSITGRYIELNGPWAVAIEQ